MVNKQEYNRLKELVSKWTKLVNIANSPSLRDQAKQQLLAYQSQMKQLFRDDHTTVGSKE